MKFRIKKGTVECGAHTRGEMEIEREDVPQRSRTNLGRGEEKKTTEREKERSKMKG